MSVLGLIDMAIAPTGAPFIIGAWGTLSILAFGTIEAPVVRVWNVVVATMAASFVVISLILAFGACWWTRALVGPGADYAIHESFEAYR